MQVRAARTGDYEAFARLFPALNTNDPVPARERWETELAPASWIAEGPEGGVLGYLYWQLLDGAAYVRQLVVDASTRRSGIGRHLLTALAAHLREGGVATWELNVDPENLPAVSLYASLGMRQEYASAALRFPWAVADALPGPALPTRILSPELDAAAEARWRLPPGQLAGFRAAPDRILVAAFEPEGSLGGCAVFDPAFPGAYPFRVTAPQIARGLLAGLRPHARHDFMQVVAEDDEALVELLVAHGATLRMRFVHLKGQVPR